MNKKLSILLVLLFLLEGHTLLAQKKSRSIPPLPVFTGEAYWKPGEGVYVFTGFTSAGGGSDTIEAVVQRSIAGAPLSDAFRVKRAENIDDVKRNGGMDMVQSLKQRLNVTDDNDVWKWMQERRDIRVYIGYLFDVRLRAALGFAGLDASAKEIANGTELRYKVKYILKSGSSVDGPTVTLNAGEPPRIQKPLLQYVTSRDSQSTIRFVSGGASSQTAYAANVYRATDEGVFEKRDYVTPARKKNDSVYYDVIDNTEPEKLYRYYIVPFDAVGNTAMNSDTASTLSLHDSRMPTVRNASLSDVPQGIRIQWSPLPPKPYWAGIEVARRQEGFEEYVVVDTVAATDTVFIDKNVLVNTHYSYALRSLAFRAKNDPPSVYVMGMHTQNQREPLAPYNITTQQEGRGVRISWEKTNDPVSRGCIVYRKTRMSDPFAAISKVSNDTTFFDNDTSLNGRIAYIYTVRSISFSDKTSSETKLVYCRPNRVSPMYAPLAPTCYYDGGMIRLTWRQDPTDGTTRGFHIWRRIKQTAMPDAAMFATKAAAKYGFTKLNKDIIRSIDFDDVTGKEDVVYEYAVSAEDMFGNESPLSQLLEFTIPQIEIAPPSKLYAQPTEKGVELTWSKQFNPLLKELRIYRREPSGGEPTMLATIKGDTPYFFDSTAKRGTDYFYSIISVNTKGKESPRSREVLAEMVK
ncbi:MAG: hypothetical protein JNL32_03260 [Candidatus Kapabacteria bacterium]|nr:hypothetical protein [Candidatus Kapabacteria bacterium]